MALVAAIALTVLGSVAHPARLDEALAKYKEFGLPLPPKGSLPVLIEMGTSQDHEGLPRTTYKLGFATPAGQAARVLVGTSWHEARDSYSNQRTKPLRPGQALAYEPAFSFPEFGTSFTSYAVQAHSLGLSALASELLSRRSPPTEPGPKNASYTGYPAEDSLSADIAADACRAIANRLLEPKPDYVVLAKRLDLIAASGLMNHADRYGYGFPAFCRALRAAAKPALYPAIEGEVEVGRLIDSTGAPALFWGSWPPDDICKRILNLGVKAVPALVNHFEDIRPTRTRELAQMAIPDHIVPVCDAAKQLVLQISKGEIIPSNDNGVTREAALEWYRKVTGG